MAAVVAHEPLQRVKNRLFVSRCEHGSTGNYVVHGGPYHWASGHGQVSGLYTRAPSHASWSFGKSLTHWQLILTLTLRSTVTIVATSLHGTTIRSPVCFRALRRHAWQEYLGMRHNGQKPRPETTPSIIWKLKSVEELVRASRSSDLAFWTR